MISLKLLIVIAVAELIFFLTMLRLVKRKKLDIRYAFAWLTLELIILVLAIWPGLLNLLAHTVGIAAPVNMLFFFGFCISLCIIFSLSMAVSHLNDRVKKLAQEIAILKKGIYENEITSDKQQDDPKEEGKKI